MHLKVCSSSMGSGIDYIKELLWLLDLCIPFIKPWLKGKTTLFLLDYGMVTSENLMLNHLYGLLMCYGVAWTPYTGVGGSWD